MNWQLRRELLTNVAAVMGGGLTAALNLDFTTLTPATMATAGVTFSRASLAGQYDSTGKWTFAPGNLILDSGNQSSGNWTASGVGVASAGAVGPGGVTAYRVTVDSSSGLHRLSSSSVSVLTGEKYMVSCYVKADSGTPNVFLNANSITGGKTNFKLSDQSMVTSAGSAAITSAGSGWYLISVTGSCPTDTSNGLFFQINQNTSAADESYAGNGTDSFLVCQFQVERVTYETSPRTYNPTTASAYYGPRFDYNPSTLAAKGLLIEEARTNKCLRSQELSNAAWTTISNQSTSADAAVAPDGTTTADTCTITSTAAVNLRYQSITVSSGATVTASLYAKNVDNRYVHINSGDATSYDTVTFDLQSATVTQRTAATWTHVGDSITDVGGGWYRLTVTTTIVGTNVNLALGLPSTGTPSVNANGNVQASVNSKSVSMWGVMLEEGAFSSSYIPTTSASATRAADNASMTSTNFSSWFNASAGTFVCEMAAAGPAGGAQYGAFSANDGSSSNRIDMRTTAASLLGIVSSGGGTTFAPDSGDAGQSGHVANTFAKCALAYAVNDFAYCKNAATVDTDASGAVAVSPDRLFIGDLDSGPGSNQTLSGWIKSLKFYASRLPNATLQSLTT